MALILRYFTEFRSFRGAPRKSGRRVEDVVVKSSRSLSHLLMSFLLCFDTVLNFIFVYYVLFYINWILEYMDFHIPFERWRHDLFYVL